jgi:hypothetical protein
LFGRRQNDWYPVNGWLVSGGHLYQLCAPKIQPRVDIDLLASEVAQLSLYLKLLEDETVEGSTTQR